MSIPLVRESVPLTVTLALSVTPPDVLIVRLPSTEVEVGSSFPVVTLAVPAYMTFTLVPKFGTVVKLPIVREIVATLPSETLLMLLLSVPLVRVSVPSTVTSPPRLMPFARFKVRLLTAIAGSVVVELEPPMTMFDVFPPVKLPLVEEMAPLMVSVFAPIESVPLVSTRVPLTSQLPFKVSEPLNLFRVRLLKSGTDG